MGIGMYGRTCTCVVIWMNVVGKPITQLLARRSQLPISHLKLWVPADKLGGRALCPGPGFNRTSLQIIKL